MALPFVPGCHCRAAYTLLETVPELLLRHWAGTPKYRKKRKCSLNIKVPGNSVHPMGLSFASTQDLQNMLLCGARISLGSDCHHISQLVPLMAVIEIKSGLLSVSKQLFSTCSAFTSVTLKARQVSPRFANGHSALLQAGALHTRLQNALVIAPRYAHQSLPEVHFFLGRTHSSLSRARTLYSN